MALDPSIPLRVNPVQINDPLDQYGKMMALKGAQRQYTLEDDIAQSAQMTNAEPGAMADELLRRGHAGPALQLRAQKQHGEQLALANKREDRRAVWEGQDHAIKMDEHRIKVAQESADDSLMLHELWTQSQKESGGDPIMAVTKVQPVWTQIRNKWIQRDPTAGDRLPEGFDPDKNYANIGQAHNLVDFLKSQHPKYGAATDAVNPATGKPDLYQPPAENATEGRFLGVAPAAKPAQPTELNRLMAERDALPPNHPDRAQYDKTIADYKAGRGDTNVSVSNGPMTPTKTAATKVDEDLLAASKGLMQLHAIQQQYKPEFQQFQDRVAFSGLATKEKLGGKLTNKQKQDLSNYSSYRRNAAGSMNAYIKEITGQAMSVQEAERITKGMPNPGQGLFDGDSPTEFQSKMNDAMTQTKMAIARLSYIKRNGMSLMDGNGNPVVSLARMPAIINKRGADIEKELSKTGIKGSILDTAVHRQLAIEFGLADY